jgi:hypothetical protein
MTGRLVAVAVLAFGAGWVCGVINHVRRCGPAMIRLASRLFAAEKNQDHTRCRATIDAMGAYIAHQERRLDLLDDDPAELPGEVERWLHLRGGA